MSVLIESLLRPEAYPHPVAATGVQLLETHISWVLLTGDYAYKLKKPVNFGFVDFSTRALRQFCCEEELRLNRRWAPELYLGVQPIFGPKDQASFLGTGEPIEFAVQMRQFEQTALLSNVLTRGELTEQHLDRFVNDLVRFQSMAAVAGPETTWGTEAAVRAPVEGNFRVLDRLADHQSTVRRLREWSAAQCVWLTAADHWEKRRAHGKIREGHGDLHLGNLMLRDGIVVPFDCLEFNPGLRWIDVVSELAFLVMDLQERGRPDFARLVLDQWRARTGDACGLYAWRWYTVYRALVRAKVAAIRLDQPDITPEARTRAEIEVEGYLDYADHWTGKLPIGLVVMHGLSGSGKSVAAAAIARHYNFLTVRTDIERKRDFGSLPADELYAPQTTEAVYAHAAEVTIPALLAAGFPVVVDAACLRRAQRDQLREVAAALHVPCQIVEVSAPAEVLRQRIATRQAAGRDPSDATLAVLEGQLCQQEPLTDEERSQAVSIETTTADWEAALLTELKHRWKKVCTASLSR